MTIDIAGLEFLQVKYDGVFPLTSWVNFTDVDPRSVAFGASFCVAAVSGRISLSRVEEARDRKRAQFRQQATASLCLQSV